MTVDWAKAAARLLKAELAREGLTFAGLAERLNAAGIEETEASVKNKVWRGTFSTVFLLQCLHVIGRDRVDLTGLLPASPGKETA